MLPPSMQWARSHGLLAEDDELPHGLDPSITGSRWIWEELVSSSTFRLDTVRSTQRLGHVSDLLSYGEAEHLATSDHLISWHPPRALHRPLIGTDSQVVAACVAKGRSASPRLNGILRTFLPNVLAQNLYTQPFWIGTKFNTADDPTRDAPLRLPSGPFPQWALDVAAGNFAAFDVRARDLTYDASAPA